MVPPDDTALLCPPLFRSFQMPISFIPACFLQVDQEATNPRPISGVTFSNDGKLMAVSMEGRMYVMDALDGTVRARFDNGLDTTTGPAVEASFSPDSRYLISGGGWVLVCNGLQEAGLLEKPCTCTEGGESLRTTL